jgi:putative sterol carrier protein
MATLGTIGVYEELARLLDDDPDWPTLSRELDYSMIHVYSAPIAKAFHIRFDRGQVTDVHEVPDVEVEKADFVLTGAPDVWKRVFSKVPKARASAFHLALSTGQIRFTGPFMQTYLKQVKAWEHLLDVMSLNQVAAG